MSAPGNMKSSNDALLENTSNDENTIETSEADHSVNGLNTDKKSQTFEIERLMENESDSENQQGSENNVLSQARSPPNDFIPHDQHPNVEFVLPIGENEAGLVPQIQGTLDDMPTNQIPNEQPIRALVEWVYPDDDVGNQNATDARNVPNDEDHVDYVVDPAHTYVTLEVEGVVVQPRRCFIKMFGFECCSDAFPSVVNPKAIPILLTVICGAIVGIYFLSKQMNSESQISIKGPISSKNNNESRFPSIVPSFAPSHVPIHPRIVNITQLIHDISGDIILIDGSAQNKALQWILYNDTMALEYNSTNIVQRYVLMVLFYGLSGENWVRKEGFGSSKHECEWYGMICTNTVTHAQKLTTLDLNSNNLRGSLSSEMAQLQGLKTIKLYDNGLSSTIISEIGQLQKLLNLQLRGNSLTGPIPEEIGNCKGLKNLELQENRLKGTIPSAIGSLRSLQELFVHKNQLSGPIPSEIGNIRLLRKLFLHANELIGTIPPELGQSFLLEDLRLYENQLTGTIPSSFAESSDLEVFLLYDNMLSGTIPSLLYQLPKLRDFELHNNQLTGTIPDFTMTSTTTTSILLDGNRLSGTVPESFSKFSRLERLHLQNTDLSGSIPESICNLSLITLKADCAGEDPEVSCSCCTECFK